MTQLKCLNTCYMETGIKPNGRVKGAKNPVTERFEDEEGGVYEVEENLVDGFLATGNFEVAVGVTEEHLEARSMELSPDERDCILDLLPTAGDLSTLRIVRGIKEQLETGGTKSKVVEVSSEALQLIRDEFRQLADTESLPLEWLPVYERFA